jgi:endonuclease III
VLVKAHPELAAKSGKRRAPVEELANSAETCGAVANVLDALIGTILSQNTSARNSTAAKLSLDARFGLHGFEAIAKAPREDVVDAIRAGGLANRKAKAIQTVLSAVYAQHGVYSLDHLRDLPDSAVMAELCGYAGVGPKTAACVLLFALDRDSAFAVDTHVFRLSQMLGWIPASANRIQAQAHLDDRIPDALKYDLHVLMVAHGRACKGCKAGARAKASACVLKSHVSMERKRKASGSDRVKSDIDANQTEEVVV